MYDELVKALRGCVLSKPCDGCPYYDPNGPTEKCATMNIAAADAIEELEKAAPRWISVTERLPESGVHVLACCRVKWVGGGGRFYVCGAFYSAPKTEVCSYNDDIDAEYDEETDEYYMPEGWWEVIKNWDDYSCVVIGDFVTHWMPLPEPPEKESES